MNFFLFQNGDCAIHIAARDGLLAVTQALCTLGCSVEVPNAKGLYPLHLAARNGHIHIVRLVQVPVTNSFSSYHDCQLFN